MKAVLNGERCSFATKPFFSRNEFNLSFLLINLDKDINRIAKTS